MFSNQQLLQFNSLVHRIYLSSNLQELCVNVLTGLDQLVPYHFADFIRINPQKSEMPEPCKIIVDSFNPPLLVNKHELLYASPPSASSQRGPARLQAGSMKDVSAQHRADNISAQYIHFSARVQITHHELLCGELALHRMHSHQTFNEQEILILKLLREHINSCFSHVMLKQLNKSIHCPQKNQELTRRESQIAALIGQGKTNKQIAQDLGISENTVKTIMKRLYHKLGVHSRSELIRELYDLTPLNHDSIYT